MWDKCQGCGESKILVAADVIDREENGDFKTTHKEYLCRECVYKKFEDIFEFRAIL